MFFNKKIIYEFLKMLKDVFIYIVILKLIQM
jgi:hypothetical protein